MTMNPDALEPLHFIVGNFDAIVTVYIGPAELWYYKVGKLSYGEESDGFADLMEAVDAGIQEAKGE